MPLREGLIQIYTGNGKGKTTAALGQALRACGHGLRVLMIQFMKGSTDYGEVQIAGQISGFKLVQSGLPTFVKKFAPSEEDLRLAAEGVALAAKAMDDAACDILILDEINVAVDYGLVNADEIVALIQRRPPGMEIILTGRYAPTEFLEIADLVTEMKEVKHHYAAGKAMREGIEY
ncbi:MAG TPA: cob(I)yrinic acid a,c-diamide adenosyltransferase [bacterium]|nr:cob(I)yrinic acid a,c-diamide adenosyltransferase [bacterium]